MIEMLGMLGLLGIAFATALPTINPARIQITKAQRVLIANLRLARSSAITKNVHYAVTFPSSTNLKLQRMKLQNGVWIVDTTQVQTISLPSGTKVPSSLVGSSVEYGTRGQAVNLTAVKQIDITDTFGATKSTQAWPSGQVNEL